MSNNEYLEELNSKLISHRLRGFDNFEQTKIGLKNALSEGVKKIEVDLRLTADNHIVVYHDVSLGRCFERDAEISELSLESLKNIKYKDNSDKKIMTLDELLAGFSKSADTSSLLCLDVKEHGFEEQLLEKINKYSIKENTVIISWLPEVLFKVHELDKHMRLCFSHIPLSKVKYFFYSSYSKLKRLHLIRLFANMFAGHSEKDKAARLTLHFNDYNSAQPGKYSLNEYRGRDHAHIVKGLLKGKLQDVIRNSGGGVCVPYRLPDADYANTCRVHNLKLCLYTINRSKYLMKINAKLKPHYILTDNPELLLK